MCTEIEDKLVTALALVYKQIPWGKMRTRHNPWDIFNHRVRSASCRKTIGEAFSRLANYFGITPMRARSVGQNVSRACVDFNDGNNAGKRDEDRAIFIV